MYGTGTQTVVSSCCTTCLTTIEFDLTVTSTGATSSSPAAATLREWDPVMTEADRSVPHMLDGF